MSKSPHYHIRSLKCSHCVSIAERRNAHFLSRQITPGGAPATVAAVPQPPNGTTAPTPSSDLADGTQPTALVKDRALTSLIQQVLDALKKATVESEKVRKYLPKFFDKLHEDLVKELRGRGEIKAANQDHSLHSLH